jgi:hypothetical protein
MASEDFATEGQIKRLYAVLHSVGLDPKQWKKDANIASYAKLTRAQCSTYIDEVEALEAELKAEGAQGHLDEASKGAGRKIEQGEQRFGDRAEAEAEKIRQEQGRGAPGEKPDVPKEAPPTVAELILKFTDILAQVTVAVEQEDRIPKNEKGYATNWVANVIKDALNIGGNHEEQA